MSAEETVAARVENIRRALPPKEGRDSRIGYLSVYDFAELLGATAQLVITWRKGRGYPSEKYRERLAELSGGRYTADDFKRPEGPRRDEDLAELLGLVEELSGRVDRLEEEVRARPRARRRAPTEP